MGNAFHGPRSKANAQALLAAAKGLGFPATVVKTTRSGYMAPQEVVDAALGVDHIQEGVVYPEPSPAPSAPRTEETPKPRGNGSREAWAEYAAAQGAEITDDLSRDDIKNLVEE
jgi:hypothetical protein